MQLSPVREVVLVDVSHSQPSILFRVLRIHPLNSQGKEGEDELAELAQGLASIPGIA